MIMASPDAGPAENPDAWRALENLTKAATVRIHLPWAGYSPTDPFGEVESFLGSGFFAAPNWVLTCAHVLYHEDSGRYFGKGEQVTVVHAPAPDAAPVALRAEVAAVLPEVDGVPSAGWPVPDLALVRLLEPSAHASVFLSDRPAVTWADGRGLFHTGWVNNGGVLDRIDGRATVTGGMGWSGGGSTGGLLRLGGDSFIAGASGSPVVDLVRGEVVAVVKSRLVAGNSGSAVDIAHLRRGLPVPGLHLPRKPQDGADRDRPGPGQPRGARTYPLGRTTPDADVRAVPEARRAPGARPLPGRGAEAGREAVGAVPAATGPYPPEPPQAGAAGAQAAGPDAGTDILDGAGEAVTVNGAPESFGPWAQSLADPWARGGTEDLYQTLCSEHDRHQSDRQGVAQWTWTDVQRHLRPASSLDLQPAERVKLLGLLADIPPPASVAALAEVLHTVSEGQLGTEEQWFAPRGWRDGLGTLHGREGTAHQQLGLYLRYVDAVLGADRPAAARDSSRAERALWAWAWAKTEELAPAERGERRRALEHRRRSLSRPRPVRAPRAARRAVLLRLFPRGWQAGTYDWQLCLEEPAPEEAPGAGAPDPGGPEGAYPAEPLVRPLGEDQWGVPLENLPTALAEPLAEAFRRCDEPGASAVLHVALPRDLLGLEVDGWRIGHEGRTLGEERPVVVRCADRAWPEQAGAEADDARRWQALHPAPRDEGIAPGIIDCVDDRPVPFDGPGQLAATRDNHVPVLCRYWHVEHTDSVTGLSSLVDAGYRVVVWRRRGDPGGAERPGHAYGDVCAGFHGQAPGALGAAHSAGHLPYLVHRWRADVAAGVGGVFWTQGLALLYDPPRALNEMLPAL
ncbi:trypsin-like peptidase domain-containing protein [Streptomyces sp. NPDC049954]|uniref:VMAP-C domain-containing protein n=1 Tax=Streptomyces sp. NPDC049954 TaxID=3155779 RepID=UPI003417C9D1